MEFHTLASIFPLMTDAEYAALKADIAQYGMRQPIITWQNKIVDGRNRYNVCIQLGIEPQFQEWDGNGDLLAFIVSQNLHRRHLNESQRAVIAEQLANMRQGERTDLQPSANLPKVSQDDAAALFNVSPRTIRSVKVIKREAPDMISRIANKLMTVHEAVKQLKERQREEIRREVAQKAKEVKLDERFNVWQADINTWQAPRQYDFIITDPPYPREYLPLYEVLAKRAKEWLVDGGLLIVMCGQSYLDEIYRLLDTHLNYYWTCAYLTPGQATPLRQRNVNTNWKPIVVYAAGNYKGKIFGDVFKSDASDKSYHEWGQSVSGMYSIISQICLPGQYILDPFCGAGATGVAALKHGCLFDGIDLDFESVDISLGRLHDATTI